MSNTLAIRGFGFGGSMAVGGFASAPVYLPSGSMGYTQAIETHVPSPRITVLGGGRRVVSVGGGRRVVSVGGGR